MKPLPSQIAVTIFLILLLLTAVTGPLHAQMFSIQDRVDRQAGMFSFSTLSVGWEFAKFNFTGDEEVAGTDRFDFNNESILKFNFENPGIDLNLGIGGGLTGMDNQNYLNLGGKLYNNFSLRRSEQFWVLLPVQFSTDLKRTQRDDTDRQFQQTSFQLGAGLGNRAQISNTFKTMVQLLPSFGFSNAAGAFFGGTVFTLEGKARIYLDNILGSNGLVFGYDFQHRSFNIDQEFFNYDFDSHALTIGIIF